MAKVCEQCGKKALILGITRKLRGHINPTGTRHRLPNLQWFKNPLTGNRHKFCTDCIKAYFKSAKAL